SHRSLPSLERPLPLGDRIGVGGHSPDLVVGVSVERYRCEQRPVPWPRAAIFPPASGGVLAAWLSHSGFDQGRNTLAPPAPLDVRAPLPKKLAEPSHEIAFFVSSPFRSAGHSFRCTLS